jgi:hypothetical protein
MKHIGGADRIVLRLARAKRSANQGKEEMTMKLSVVVITAALAAAAPAYAQMAPQARYTPIVYQSQQKSVVGLVKSYDSGSGALTLEDGNTYLVPNDPAQQLPSGLNTPPSVGQTVRITFYLDQSGQRIVSDLEPESRPDTGERTR